MARSWTVRAVSTALRSIPNVMPGKMRVAPALLRIVTDDQPVKIVGANGLRFHVPSLAEPIAQSILAFGHYEWQFEFLTKTFYYLARKAINEAPKCR